MIDQRASRLSRVFAGWTETEFNPPPPLPGFPGHYIHGAPVNPFLWAFDTVSPRNQWSPYKKVSYSPAYVSVFSRLNTRIYHPVHCTRDIGPAPFRACINRRNIAHTERQSYPYQHIGTHPTAVHRFICFTSVSIFLPSLLPALLWAGLWVTAFGPSICI